MKKFYYKKEDSVDKTPIVLERRNTASRDGDKEEVENRLSARTSSLGSVDHLSSASLIPRIRSKEQITKSLSEDVLVRSYMKNPGKVITERELSASRLYKNRKASMNSKDSPRKAPQKSDLSSVNPKDPNFKSVHVPHKDCPRTDSSCLFPQPATQKNDLSPVTLKDPKFKPVPVPPKDRRKGESSCMCYFGIFMAISLCTIGLLAGVTGLLYSEIFSDKNSTSHRLQESMIDLTNLIQNNSSIHEYHVLNNDTFARKVSFESANYDSSEIRRSGSSLVESEDVSSVQFKQMDMTDLSRLIDNKQAEVKFQDRDTTIFEVNTGSSAEQKNSINDREVIKEEINSAKIVISETDVPSNLNAERVPNVVPSMIETEKLEETGSPPIFDSVEQRENDGAISNGEENRDPTSGTEQTLDFHTKDHRQEVEVLKFDSETKTNGSRILNVKEEIDSINAINKNMDSDSRNVIREDLDVVDKKTEVEEKAKHIDGSLDSQFDALENSLDINHDRDLNLCDKKSISSDGPENHSDSSALESKLGKESVISTEDNNAVISLDKNISKPSAKLNRINVEFKTVTVSLPKEKVAWKAGDPIKVSNVDDESRLTGKEISSEDIDSNANSEVEHDVEAILEVIDEPAGDAQDPFDVNRNGDINIVSETGLKHNSDIFKVKRKDGDSLLRTESQSPQKDQTPKETLRLKPSNMKVSLAEAMKHLQTLDDNNKLLTSRMKSAKNQTQREKPAKSGDKQMKPFQTLDVDNELLKSRMKSIKSKAQREKPSKLIDKQIKKESISVDRMQLLRNLRLALQGNLMGL